MPAFPPAMSALAQQQVGSLRWHVPKLVAMLSAFASAALTVLSSFLPLVSARISSDFQDDELTITAWRLTSSAGDFGDFGDVPANGFPLVFGALFLFVAAVVAWFAAAPSTTPGTHRLAGLCTSAGAAFLIGTVWTVSVQSVNNVDSMISFGSLTPGFETEATYDVGFWLLLVAALLALTGVVLALLPARRPTWPPPPPQGPGRAVEAPAAHRLPPEPPPLPHLQVDPLTGQPLSQHPYGQQVPGNGFPQAVHPVPPHTNPLAPQPDPAAPAEPTNEPRQP